MQSTFLKIIVAALAVISSLTAAHAEDLERTVEFRDGSVLTLAIPDATINATVREKNVVKPAQLKLSELSELVFAVKPRLDEGKRIAALIEGLANEDFDERGSAEHELRAAGVFARTELNAASARELDPEIKARVAALLTRLPPVSDAELAEGYYDPLTLSAGHKTVQADTAGLTLTGTFQHHAVKLDRATVSRIRLAVAVTPELQRAPAAAVTSRIPDDVPEAFGKDATRIDFETAPDGTPLTAGMDIGKTFVPKGFTLATSYEDSFVSVNNYDVRGPSGGNSCATQNPLWNGTVTIRFCVPGQPKIPAGVTRVGLWIAEVTTDGTALEAYDAADRRIAEIKVVKVGNDFLGVKSTVPIAYVKIVPNPAIDPNYSFDDLIFDTPRPFRFAPHDKLFTVLTRSGDKMLTKNIAVSKGSVHLGDVSVGIDALDYLLTDAATIVTPSGTWKSAPLPSGCWLKLRDGSVLHAAVEDGPVCSRVPLKLTPQTISAVSAMWGDTGEFLELPPKTPIPEGGGVYVDKKGSLAFSVWKFGKQFIDEPHFTPAGDPDQRWSAVKYSTASTTWFAPDPVVPPEAGCVQLLSGESLVLTNDPAGFVLEVWTEKELIVKHGADVISIPSAEILSVTFPTK